MGPHAYVLQIISQKNGNTISLCLKQLAYFFPTHGPSQ